MKITFIRSAFFLAVGIMLGSLVRTYWDTLIAYGYKRGWNNGITAVYSAYPEIEGKIKSVRVGGFTGTDFASTLKSVASGHWDNKEMHYLLH